MEDGKWGLGLASGIRCGFKWFWPSGGVIRVIRLWGVDELVGLGAWVD